MKLYRDSKIFILCPANFASGGPELLHQLGAALIRYGIDAKMFYTDVTSDDPVHPFYKSYQVPYTDVLEDEPENIIILSETTLYVYFLPEQMQKVIWWLSVDHYLMQILSHFYSHRADPLGAPIPQFYMFHAGEHPLHLAQSEYARQFLLVNGIPEAEIYMLGDYLNPVFLDANLADDQSGKQDIVAYNPKKGFEFTSKIIEAAPDIRFVPIQDMTPEEVETMLKQAKVYIDFGYHPGKDRIPREAAICSCCVITGRQGAAANPVDIPIPDRYKFADDTSSIPGIIEMIRSVFSDYDAHNRAFDAYREMIRKEPTLFEEGVRHIFVENNR